MTDTLSTFVLAHGSSDAFPPFIVEDGAVKLDGKVLLQPFNDKLILVFEKLAVTAIKDIDALITFGTLVTELRASNTEVVLSTGYTDFMNPDDRFNDFLTNGTTFGLDLTENDRAIPALFAALKAKFETAFTPPVPPRTFATLPALTADQQTWLDNKANRELSLDPLVPGNIGNTMLRIGYAKDGVTPMRLHTFRYAIRITTAKRLWDQYLKNLWRDAPVSDRRIRGSIYPAGVHGSGVVIYGDRIEIGCQRVSRAFVERIALILGWEM